MLEEKYDIHFISFKRRGESAYNVLYRGDTAQPWQYKVLERFLQEIATQPVEGAEDLA